MIRQDLARLGEVVAVPGGIGMSGGKSHHGGQAVLLDHLQPDQGLTQVVVGLRDHEVDALLNRPANLLRVHRADGA